MWSVYAAGAVVSAVQVALCFLALRLTAGLGPAKALRELGLRAPIVRPLLFGLLVTSPMLIAFSATSPVDRELGLVSVLFGALFWPLAEEILYRGYAFRQLFERAGWGFWPAALAIAAVFGAGHLYQVATGGLSVWGGVGVFLITAAGSVFFSWLFLRWSFNLWVPFAVHALMNLWWQVFAVDQTALGGWLANAARLATLLVAVVATWKLTPAPGRPRAEGAAPAADRGSPPHGAGRCCVKSDTVEA